MATWRGRIEEAARVAAAFGSDFLRDFASADFRKSEDEDNSSAPGGSNEDTSANSPVPTLAPSNPQQSLLFDPFAIVEQLGYKEKPSQVSYGTLRAMCWKMPIIHAIIMARVNQVAQFATIQKNQFNYGFKVRLRDSEKAPTEEDQKFIKGMETFLLRTGVTENPRGRDSFETFLKKITYDSLVYDQACFEIVPNRLGQPAQFVAVDGATIRLADVPKTRMSYEDEKTIRYVQVYDGIVINEYSVEEMAFGIRNPRADLKTYGYGTSELEMMVQAVTALLWGWDYNARFFSQGSAQKGILNFKGSINDRQLNAFRRHWYNNLASVENAWRTPITNAQEGIDWVNLQQTNRDMEFSAWIDFLIKVACAFFQMDPVEVNFKYGNTGQRSAMNEAGNREKIIESRERGLRPLLRFIANQINLHILWPINESFEISFVGLDARTPEEQAELYTKRVKTYRTVNELRAEEDLPPIDGGDVILDSTYAQLKNAAMAGQTEGGDQPGEQGDQQGGDEGDFDFEAMLADLEEDEEDTDDPIEKAMDRVRIRI